MTNVYERDRRAAKVLVLCQHIDALARRADLDPVKDRLLIAVLVQRFDDKAWAQLCINAGKRPASEATRLAVVNAYLKPQRAEQNGQLINEAF